MDRTYTGFTDKTGSQIYEGDILHNSFAGDLWAVVKNGGEYEAWLIPNSGFFGHPDNKYPAYTEPLKYIHEVFQVVGNVKDNPEMMAHVNQS